jgi:hypothetical protein
VTSLRTEEDVRSKIVVPWLLAIGFNNNEISLEFSFRIKIGRSIVKVSNGRTTRVVGGNITPAEFSTFTSRADILVRNGEGQNLLIVEVKAPDECLDDPARDQGISYARLLADGNMAPYVVLTNGASTRIFDSFTREDITKRAASIVPACRNKTFLIDPTDLALRAEALETLISFSPGNLLAFCNAQSEFRMKPLLSNNFDSDKKFIPQLFVEREEAGARFTRLLEVEKRRVVLLIGHPQVGKTNFVCQAVIDRLANGKPCLFYPAIGLGQSLLSEIAGDFEWSFGSAHDSHSQLIRKICSVLRRLGTTLTIFVDGWNETNIQLARTIDAECSRLSGDQIQIVVTLTNTAATRLLKGSGGNPSFLAEEAGISNRGAELIEVDPEAAASTLGWSYVHVKKYSEKERNSAYEKYRLAYQVTISKNHVKSSDPYIIGVAMKRSAGQSLPDLLDEPELLRQVLEKKIERAVGLDDFNVLFSMRELAREIFHSGSPVSLERISRIWGIPASRKLPDGLFDSALIAKETDKFGMPSIDFYFGRERDYAIAYLSQDWGTRLAAREDLSEEFTNAVRTEAGTDALRWFFRQRVHIASIRNRDGTFPHFESDDVRRVMLSGLCEYVHSDDTQDDALASFASSCSMTDRSLLVRIEALKLVALIADDADELTHILTSGASIDDFVAAVLGIGEEYPLRADTAGRVVLDALRDIHWESDPTNTGDSDITFALTKLCCDPAEHMRIQANACFGYVAPFAYIEHVAGQIASGSIYANSNRLDEYTEGLKQARSAFVSSYYGDMCPGSRESICDDLDTQEAEYEHMATLLHPIIAVFRSRIATDEFLSIIQDLGKGLPNVDARDAVPRYVDIHTLQLPFDE